MKENTELKPEPLSLAELYARAGLCEEDVPPLRGLGLHPDMAPMPHQLGDLNNIFVYGATWGLFSEAGCGKTLPAQAAALYYALSGVKVLILMPPTLLRQFKRSLMHTFPGVEDQVTVHTLSEDPYPSLLPKKKVQQIKRDLQAGERSFPYPRALAKRVMGMHMVDDIPFTREEIDWLRRAPLPQAEVAQMLGCSTGAVSALRSGKLREDLYATWQAADTWPELLMMSYQMFLRVPQAVLKHYTLLIADEVHNYLCHPGSATYKKVQWFVRGAGRDAGCIPMTGTPIPNVPSDAYGLVRLLHPTAYGSLADFEALHVDSIRQSDSAGRQFKVVTGYRNLDLLRINLFARASRAVKEDVFTLDKPQIIEVDVHLGSEHLALYKKLVRERVLEVNGQTISAVQASSLRQKALQIATNPDPFTDRPIKDNQFRAMLTEILDEIGCKHLEKVVVFAIYHSTIEAMAKWFEEYNPAIVYGKSNTAQNVDKFLTDPTCRLMLAHYRSGGVGLNLQDVCRYVVCAEPTSVPAEFSQATDRVYRKGQKKVVTFYVMKVLGTGWPRQVSLMRGKMRLSQAITLDKSELLDELLGDTD